MADYIGMTPTVVIGLGGTGKEILIKVRRMIVEAYGSLDALPIVSFLHIDTEQNAKVSEAQTVLKQNIGLSPSEQVWAKVENAKAMLNQLSAYNYLEEWFPSQLKGTDSILAGAGQIRALGKFAFAVNYQAIKNSFTNAKVRILGHEKFMLDRWGLQLDKGINIFIVCSLSGGTGSGMVLDLAYNLRDWVPPSEMPQSSAYLVLPGAFSGLGDRVIANAYSALMELNHYSRNDTRFECQYSSNSSDRITTQNSQDVPFNFCYLVGNSNDKVTLPSLNSVLEMVGQNIFLDFSSGFSQYKKLVRDNIRKQWASPDSFGYPQNFIAFGLSSIQFPIQRVVQACASRLAGQVVRWWQNPTPAPGSMRDLIQTEILPSLNLAESDSQHQLLDSISLGDSMKPYGKEVADWIASLRKRRNDLNIPFENLQRFISVEQEKYSPHFNDSDSDPRRWSDYFQKMSDNLNRLKIQKRQEIRHIVYSMIADRFRGPKFVRQFLEGLLEVFNNYRSQFDQERQKNWLPKEQSAANALQVLLKQIDNNAKRFNPVNKKAVIEQDFNGTMEALKSIYTAKVEVKSRSLGVLLLDALKEEVNSLIVDLTAFEQSLETLQTQLNEREKTYVGETSTLTVNGILLYNPKDIDLVFNQILEGKTETVYQKVSQDILDDMGIPLFDLYKFDPLRVKDLFGRLLNRSVDEFVDKSQLQISTARKFLEQYPTVEQQEAQIKTTFEKSESFLRFSQEQVNLGWENKAEKRQTLIGIQGGTKPSDAAVNAVLPIIRKSSTLTDKDIRPLNDPHHIFFVQEVGAFPLRLIEGMEKMRVIYRTVNQSDKNPLHTHQDHRQFQDIMPSSQEEGQIKQNLLLAKAFGLIVVQENKVTGFEEIRFFYIDKQTGLQKVQVLGDNWQKVEENLLSDQNRKIRDILADGLKAIGESAITKPEKQQLYQKLMSCLQEVENTLVGGKDNTDYQKAEAAIENYIKQYNLMVATSSANTPITVPATTISNKSIPINDENLEKFRKLVATCYKSGNPSATELQLVEKFRQKYNISQDIADLMITEFMPSVASNNAVEEYTLMYQAFLGNDGEIDLEEQVQLLELQEELGLTNEQISQIESKIQAELAAK
ncbi:tubulin-like doman-containing protein [Dolichospermum heterosporum]|uniref:Tubulin-like doman-containing protein n=1 Tax=Dolichospermum heterosporum TAC447 TaxID=747523 RepID=A0ABY5LTJ3_9CYAN|nr:tubulin-like doman-containing protein [Dolichospermum heterosporum]UUO14585.1 tubulin-like doman-containing protein [Dolichospermum heterosporum TAC447]